jgi:two-component sensor histidine kinase
MKAEITLANSYYNKSLFNYFFREQAQEELINLLNKVEEDIETVSDIVEELYEDIDEVEEVFYNENLDEIIELFNLTRK